MDRRRRRPWPDNGRKMGAKTSRPAEGPKISDSLLLSFLCLVLLPLSFGLAVIFYRIRWVRSITFRTGASRDPPCKRVLLTGDHTATTLATARLLHAAGNEVVVLDYERIPFANCLRGSNAVKKFVGLPAGRVVPTLRAIWTRLFRLPALFRSSPDTKNRRASANLPTTVLLLVEREKIDMWIPGNSSRNPQATLQAQDAVWKNTKCKVFAPDSEAAKLSRDHMSFARYVAQLDRDISFPGKVIVRSRSEIHKFLARAPRGHMFLLEKLGTSFRSSRPGPIVKRRDSGYSRFGSDDGIEMDDQADDAGQEHRILPLGSMNENYNSVASMVISSDRPWMMYELIQGKPCSVSALIVNNKISAFTASMASEKRNFSAAPKRTSASHGQLQVQNDIKEWQQHEQMQILDPRSALVSTLTDFTRTFAARLKGPTNAQLNLHFIITETTTPSGARQRIWATGCDFRLSLSLVQQARLGQVEQKVGAAYAGDPAGEEVALPVTPNTISAAELEPYSLPSAAVTHFLLPILNFACLRASMNELMTSWADLLHKVAYGQEELLDSKDPWPWMWRWNIQAPVEIGLDLIERIGGSWMANDDLCS